MIAEFLPGSRLNWGAYVGDLSYKHAREVLLDRAAKSLKLAGEPEWLGSVSDAKGHSRTGIPAGDQSISKAPKGGCMTALLALAGVGYLAVYETQPFLW